MSAFTSLVTNFVFKSKEEIPIFYIVNENFKNDTMFQNWHLFAKKKDKECFYFYLLLFVLLFY